MAQYKLTVIRYSSRKGSNIINVYPVNIATFEKRGFTEQDKKGLMFTLEAMGAKKVKGM